MAGQREFLRPFASVFGEPERSLPIPKLMKETLAHALPQAISDILDQEGIASYRDDALRTLNPLEWKDITSVWTDKFPDAMPFAMTSFGDYFFWADRAIWVCFVQYARIMFCMESADSFLNDFLTDSAYLNDLGIFKNNRKAIAAVGARGQSEIYSWEPAFALGGSPDTSSIGKGDTRVTLKILASLQAVEVQNI